MSSRFPPYVKAGACRSGPQPGARALMAWCLEWPSAGNSGIYNCRRVAGTQVRSLHGEGRALDVSFPVVNGKAHASGWALVRALLPHVGALGIQCVIWDRTIWSRSSPNGARYRGAHAHTDHIHVELTWHAANYLNLATVRAVMRGASNVIVVPKPPVAVKPEPQPTPEPEFEDDDEMTVCYKIKGSEEYWIVAGVWRTPTTVDVWNLHVYSSHVENRTRHLEVSRNHINTLVVPATQRADQLFPTYHNSIQIARATGVANDNVRG